MEWLIERKWFKPTYTVGNFYVNGELLCNSLEDKVRDLTKEPKVYGETAIPPGRYRVILSYSPKFKRKMPRVLNVPFFEGILIHAGVSNKNTLGCPLVGLNKIVGGLVNSKYYESKLIELLTKCTDSNEEVWVTVK